MKGIVYLAVAVLALASARAGAEELVPPPTGASLVGEVGADGVQIYACEAKDNGFAWVFKAPEANLFDGEGRQVGTHFAGPTWKAADGSAVVGEVVARGDAPAKGSIPWLLLRAKSHDGAGRFATVDFIRRSDTKGGAGPMAPCDKASIGSEARMRYSATYQFYRAPK